MNHEKTFALKGDVVYTAAPGGFTVVEQGYAVCENGRSAGVFCRLPEQFDGIRVEDCGQKLIIPGLVDLHLHAPQYSFRGLGMDLELLDWLETHTFPEEAKFCDLDYAERAYTLFTDALSRGATTRACVFATVHVPATLCLMELLERTGIRAMVGKVNMDRNCPDSLREQSAAVSLGETRRWLEGCAGKFKNVSPILTPRFIPSCTDELMRGLGALQQATGLPVQSHLSENHSEIEWVQQLCP